MVGLRDLHGLEAARAVAVGAEDLELVQALEVERERRLRAVDLPDEAVPVPEREPGRLDRPDGAALEGDRRLDRVVDLAALDEGRRERAHGRDPADEEVREVDDVRAQVAERARARLRRP